MHHKYIQVLQPQHANTQYSCRDKRRRDKQQYSSARSIPSRRRGKRKAMAGRSSRRAAPPCRHPGSAGSTAGTPSLASPFQVRTRQRILVAPARRLQFLDSPLYAAARSGRGKKRRRTEQIRPLAIKKAEQDTIRRYESAQIFVPLRRAYNWVTNCLLKDQSPRLRLRRRRRVRGASDLVLLLLLQLTQRINKKV